MADDTKQCWQEIFHIFPTQIDIIHEQMGRVDFNYSIAMGVIFVKDVLSLASCILCMNYSLTIEECVVVHHNYMTL